MKNLISLRLYDHHKDEAIFEELLSVLSHNRNACDEIWLTTDAGFPPLEVHRQNAFKMAAAAERLRKNGLIASLQIGNTLGHGDFIKFMDFSGITWQRMVGHDGAESPYCNCPRDPEFLNYMETLTHMYCEWQPDTVWIDDDLRMNNHASVTWGCFCNKCVTAFCRSLGKLYTRDALVQKINEAGRWDIRKKWLEFNSQSLGLVIEAIAKAVASVSPATDIGLQSAAWDFNSYSGKFYHSVSEAVQKLTGRKMKCRPGGSGEGYYSDHNPSLMLNKALYINNSNNLLKDCIDDSRPEIESFPHTAMSKTPHGLAVESALYLAHGCNALTYAIMVLPHERPAFFGDILSTLGKWRPFWERYLEHNRNTVPGGVTVCYNGNQCERPLYENERPFEWTKMVYPGMGMMTSFGLPLTFYGNQPVNLLHPDVVDGYSERELAELFAGGVITDGAVIDKLSQRGLGHLTGVEAENTSDRIFAERLTHDPLNGVYSESLWHQFVPPGSMGRLKLYTSNPGTRIIGEYINYDRSTCGMASMLAQTPAGGRLAVFGYNPWEPVVSSARRHQILAACDWVSGGKLPVRVDKPVRLVAVPRVDQNGVLHSVLFLNASIDHTPETPVRVRNPAGPQAEWLDKDCKAVSMAYSTQNNEHSVTIPSIAPWDIGVLTFQKTREV